MSDAPSYILISVKEVDIVENLARTLQRRGVKILATDGTHKRLQQIDIASILISEYTGMAEVAQGQVKTMHPRILGGILTNRAAKTDGKLEVLDDGREIFPIDYVIVQPYPFREQVIKEDNKAAQKFEKLRQFIDIGGISLLRAAAKNHRHVCPLYEKEDCDLVAEILDAQSDAQGSGNGIADEQILVSQELRKILATKVFQLTALYDAMIVDWLNLGTSYNPLPSARSSFAYQTLMLRYGENSHQSAALYTRKVIEKPPSQLRPESPMICGRSPSYNNLLDAYKATSAVLPQGRPCCAIVKHGNISGFACADEIEEAFLLAYRCDTLSAYGGVIAVNRPCHDVLLEETKKIFLSLIAAPSFSANVLEIIANKKPEPPMILPYPRLAFDIKSNFEVRSLGKHMRLLQSPNNTRLELADINHKGEKEPSIEQKRAMLFAFAATKLMTSNSIAIVRTDAQATIGLGCGQTSRVDAAHIAIHKAQREGHDIMGSAAASDGFIPFPDAIAALAQAGVKAVVHPGGGKREKTIIDFANKLGIVLCSTGGLRAFSH